MRCQDLKLVKEGIAIVGVRPTVDVDDKRVSLALNQTERLDDPSFDIPSVSTLELDMAGWTSRIGAEDLIGGMRAARERMSRMGHCINLGHTRIRLATEGDRPVCCG